MYFHNEGFSKGSSPYTVFVGIVTVFISYFHLPEYLEGDEYANLLSFEEANLGSDNYQLQIIGLPSVWCSVQNFFQ